MYHNLSNFFILFLIFLSFFDLLFDFFLLLLHNDVVVSDDVDDFAPFLLNLDLDFLIDAICLRNDLPIVNFFFMFDLFELNEHEWKTNQIFIKFHIVRYLLKSRPD